MSRQKKEIVKDLTKCKYFSLQVIQKREKKLKIKSFTIIICLNEMIVVEKLSMTRQFVYERLHSREVYSVSCLDINLRVARNVLKHVTNC